MGNIQPVLALYRRQMIEHVLYFAFFASSSVAFVVVVVFAFAPFDGAVVIMVITTVPFAFSAIPRSTSVCIAEARACLSLCIM